MTRIAIVAPNGGTDLAFGGGAYTVVQMASSLARSGHEVLLLSVMGLEKTKLEEEHHTNLGNSTSISTIFRIETKVKRFPFVLTLILARKLERAIRMFRPDVVIFNDDSPRCLQNYCRSQKILTVLYVHSSYWARSHYPSLFAGTTFSTPLEGYLSLPAVRNLLAPLDSFEIVLCNSRVNQRLVEPFVDASRCKILPPPAQTDSHSIKGAKFPSVLHCARQDTAFLEKSFLDGADILASRLPSIRFIVTNSRPRFRRRSVSHTNVTALSRMSVASYSSVLDRSQYVASFKWFEGFGIATVEAMSHGCIPLVYASNMNASWTDVVDFGKYGLGFVNAQDFADKVKELECDSNMKSRLANSALTRSLSFTNEQFEHRLLEHLRPMLN